MSSHHHDPSEVIRPAEPLIVGIGASAGGLEALETFCRAIPEDSRLAFVVIQHLSPDFPSLMDEILSRQTSLTMQRAEDGMTVEPGCVYLIPPKKDMTLDQGLLRLTDKDPTRPLEMPIDIFFRSLAQHAGARAVGVILSGTGADGSRGIVDIHEAGGLVLVQSPDTARFDGMPRSALATGAVDLSMAPDAMPEIIHDFAADPQSVFRELQVFPDQAPSEAPEGLMALEMLKRTFGIDFTMYKQSTIGRRMARRMALRQIHSLTAYLDLLGSSPEELGELSRDLLIGVTSFFRDADAFARLESHILPELLRKCSGQDEFRVWVAGCATGEEVYSLGMLVMEEAERQGFRGKITLFATDVHRQSLEIAAQGMYDKSRLGGITQERRARFFREDSGMCRVVPELRALVVFAPHNVLSDPPFTRMHLVSCRNMLIYLQPRAQERAVSMFHFALNVECVLFMGSSESPGSLASEFDTIDSKHKLYRKRRDVKLPMDLRMAPTERQRQSQPLSRTQVCMDRGLLRDYDMLLNRYVPMGLLVSPQREVLHYFGNISRFLVRMAGRAERDVLDMVDGDLRLALTSALHRAGSERGVVVFRHVRVVTAEGEEWVDLSVECLRDEKISAPHFHIALVPIASPVEPPSTEDCALRFSPTDGAWERICDLESELQTTRENLQATIEELQTTNEELQATNEEMLAANEELQSTNEELHSVNEELYTVNAEFEKKNKELRELNDDHDNLLRSTEVGTLFLDTHLCIRRFNPAITRSFKLLPQDVGRPVDHIAYQHENQAAMLQDLRQVLQTGVLTSQEIQTGPEAWLLRRTLPFLDRDGAVKGVVLTFTDISEIKHAEEARHQFRLIRDIATSVPGLVFQFQGDPDKHGRFTFISDGARELLGPEQTRRLEVGTRLTDFVHDEDEPDFTAAMRRAVREGAVLDLEHRVRGLEQCWVQTRSTPRQLGDGTICWNGVSVNVTDRKMQLQRIAEAADFYLTILRTAPALIWRAGPDSRCNWFNETWLQFTGRSLHEELGVGWSGGVHPDDLSRCVAVYEAGFSARRPFEMEYRLRRQDGVYRWIVNIGTPLHHLDGSFSGYIGYCFDITERRDLTEHLSLATARAEEASRAKSEFLANMSHEIRTPLNGIMGMLQLLQLSALNVEQADYAQTALTSCERLSRLLCDILDLSRVEAGKLSMVEEPFELTALLQQTRDLFYPMARNTRLRFVCELAPNVPAVLGGDATRLQQVLCNLVGNAFKFTARGEIRVSVNRLPVAPAGHVRLLFVVSDTGQGIPEDKIRTLFKPFAQLSQGYARRYQGAGLGLSICKHLVDLMRGCISIDSEPGEGTSIYFSVLLREIDPAQLATECCGGSVAIPPGLQVLIAEDDIVSCMALQRQLEKAGCMVQVAQDGAQALGLLRGKRFDVVFMDVQMPELDGVSATRGIRAGEAGDPDIPIIAMTAYAMASDRDAFLKAGMNEYIAKPVDMRVVQALLHRMFGTAGQ